MNVTRKYRLAVVSPFLDKRHGTERHLVEWVSRLWDCFEIHVYSQAIDNVDLSKIRWHRIPKLPGPHLLNFLWFFAANHLWRAWDRHFRELSHDVVLTAGTNCLDADIISVHVVFAELLRRLSSNLKFNRNPVRFWPRLLHRHIYYRLIIALERRIYRDPRPILIHISRKTFAAVERLYGQRNQSSVLYAGIDRDIFNRQRCVSLRECSRKELKLADDRFVLLLIGNDWHTKGIRALLDAMSLLQDRPIDLLVVGRDAPTPFRAMALDRALGERVRFLPSRKDVEFYYAAADVYVGPSLEDAYAQPPAEAMACGVPTIVSAAAGVSEIITNGVDGLILDDPTDAASLASMIRRLHGDREFRDRLGENAAETAQRYDWQENALYLRAIIEQTCLRKSLLPAKTLPSAPRGPGIPRTFR